MNLRCCRPPEETNPSFPSLDKFPPQSLLSPRKKTVLPLCTTRTALWHVQSEGRECCGGVGTLLRPGSRCHSRLLPFGRPSLFLNSTCSRFVVLPLPSHPPFTTRKPYIKGNNAYLQHLWYVLSGSSCPRGWLCRRSMEEAGGDRDTLVMCCHTSLVIHFLCVFPTASPLPPQAHFCTRGQWSWRHGLF